jgi:hypothetical protein
LSHALAVKRYCDLVALPTGLAVLEVSDAIRWRGALKVKVVVSAW